MRFPGLIRDERGWKIRTRWLTFHPIGYGTATLARIGVGRAIDGPRLMLHYFPPQDYSEHYHDHPWPFVTFVLWGSYTDLSIDANGLTHTEELRRGTIQFRPARHRHKTANRRRCFTLVLCGRDEREWCEGDGDEWVCGGVQTDFHGSLRA